MIKVGDVLRSVRSGMVYVIVDIRKSNSSYLAMVLSSLNPAYPVAQEIVVFDDQVKSDDRIRVFMTNDQLKTHLLKLTANAVSSRGVRGGRNGYF